MNRTTLKIRLRKRLTSLALFGLLTLGAFNADAQEERTQRELPAATESVHQTERPTLEGEDAPQFRADQFVERRSFESIQRQDEAIVRLQEMIDRTPAGDPARAEYLFNLAEIFWERARYYEGAAIEQQDECYRLQDQGDEQGVRRCQFRKEDMEAEAVRRAEEALTLYAEIIAHYPDFEERDRVYFYLGSNYMDNQRQEEGLNIFRRLISEYPQTQYAPQVLVYFGDYYFEEGDMFQARAAYEKVTEFPDSPAYAYAVYKLGWAYFNLENYERAMEEFLNVVDIAKAAPEGTAERSMLKQVRADIVRAYARIGSPDQAIAFFQDLAPDREDWLPMAETLAIYYGNQAEFSTSTRMYRQLININQQSVAVIDYQYEIVRNQTTINAYNQEAIQEIIRMMRMITAAEEGRFEDADTDEYRRIWARVEESSRNWATTYHREAQRTLNQQLYVMAHHLYGNYLNIFTESEHQYDMQFYHGELLYTLEAWDEAAAAYERVFEIDPEGQFTEDAVMATVLALFKIVDTSEERVVLEASFDLPEGEVPPVPEPKEMDELQQRLMRAGHNYIEYVPDGEQIVEVKYNIARIYFDYDHLREAAELFSSIAFDHSEHRLAIVAANLHLASLERLQDFEGLYQAVARYTEERPVGDDDFNNDLYTMHEAISYNLCVLLDEEAEWEQAAQCYVDYVRDFPESEQVDKALYNAALDFEKIHEIGLAIQVRMHLLRMRPDSELAPDTLYNIGGNYHAWAIYGEASRFYEAFVNRFPDHENAEAALSNASTFRHGLGQYQEAIANYEKYLELFGRKRPDQAAEVVFQIAEIYQEEGRQDQAVRQYQKYLSDHARHGTRDRTLQAHLRIGLQQWEQGRRKQALDTFKNILDIYGRFSEEEQMAMTEGRDAAAQAQFMIAEDVFERAESIRIDSANEKELQERTREKYEALLEAQEIYEKVIIFTRPDWAIAALYRIGRGAHDFGEAVRKSPVPGRLTESQQEIYRGLLEDQATEFENVAVDMYVMALNAARDANWFNEYSHLAEGHLAELRPREYRRPSELRSQPRFFRDGFMSSSFVTEVEEEDMLRDLGASDEESAAEEALSDEQAAEESNSVGSAS